jgi:hypothetical protein
MGCKPMGGIARLVDTDRVFGERNRRLPPTQPQECVIKPLYRQK